MWSELLFTFINELLIPILMLVMTIIGIPALTRFIRKQGLDVSNAEEQKISQTMENLVRAAQANFGQPGTGKEKFAWVLQQGAKDLASVGIAVARHDLEVRIEAAHSKIFSEPVAIVKAAAKETAKETAKEVAKEVVKETVKETAKAAAKAAGVLNTAIGTAVA